MGIAILAAIGFAVMSAVTTPGALVKTLIGIGALVVLFGLAYILSTSDVSNANRALGVTEGSSKLISAGLIMFYMALVLAILALLYSEISKAFK
jgi:hypothetical protein